MGTYDNRSEAQPFASYTGRGVRVAIIDSGVNPAHPHVGGVAGGVRISSGEADPTNDYLDYNGHGTAVAGAIREKAPDALLYAVKVFDRALTTNIEVIIKAIEWCVVNEIHVINLSLGTVNLEHRETMERTVALALQKGIALVAAREMSGRASLPGSMTSVIGVAVDWEIPRDRYFVDRSKDDPAFIASAYPRDIPGVPRERNLKGISFAVANMTGFVVRAREFAPNASIDSLWSVLMEQGWQLRDLTSQTMLEKMMFPELSHENFLRDLMRWVQNGGSVEATDPNNGRSLLHLAAELQDLAAIEYLVNAGCDTNLPDNHGQTPLHIAVDSEIDGTIQTQAPLEYKATKRLIELGANPLTRNNDGETPIDWIGRYGEKALSRFHEVLGFKPRA